MMPVATQRSNIAGALCALGAALCFSCNDMGIKFVSGSYALHQVVLFRSLVGMIVFLTIFLPLSGGLKVLRTRRLKMHLLRGLFVVIANSCLFLGLSVLDIADAVAIYFVLPLVVAVLSVFFLGETVGPRRWLAIGIGFSGVLLIVKPGSTAFQFASLLPAIGAFFYASMHIIARRIGGTESASTMVFYILLTFIAFCSVMGLTIGDGRFLGLGGPDMDFLFRAWAPIDPADLPVLIMLGVTAVLGGFLISQAYRLAEAAFAAPFEYVSLVSAIFWGITIFGTIPDVYAWIGILLIAGSGLYLLWRETVKNRGHNAS